VPSEAQNRRWLLFFAVLAGLSVVAVTLPIVYNLGQQLRREQLQAAWTRWQQQGPADYDLTFSVRVDRETARQRHVVCVRHGQVVAALVEGRPLHIATTLQGAIGLPLATTTDHPPWTMERIFEHLEELLRQQEQTRGSQFLVAVFDPQLGWPRRFVWRVARTSQRQEWDLKLWRPGELETEAMRYR